MGNCKIDDRALHRMEKFRNFPPGWHYTEGVPLDPRVHMVALWIYSSVEDLDVLTDAFPCEDCVFSVDKYISDNNSH